MTTVSLPAECSRCILQPMFCNIRNMLTKDPGKWLPFAALCGTISENEVEKRILKVETAAINNFYRGVIIDDVFASFFSPAMLFYPSEMLKRVLNDKFIDVFSELSGDQEAIDYAKWTLRMEVISKFCQLSEILGAHLLASEATGGNFKSHSGYASKLIEYEVSDATNLFKRIPSMTDAELITIMGYPAKDKQSEDGKSLINRSLFELKFSLELVGEEYAKFRELYNAYKHGCRLTHPRTASMEGSNAAGTVMFLTWKSSVTEGGEIKLFEFPNEDFNSFFNLIRDINAILGIMLENRRTRYDLENKISSDAKITLYFSPDLTAPSDIAKDITFIL